MEDSSEESDNSGMETSASDGEAADGNFMAMPPSIVPPSVPMGKLPSWASKMTDLRGRMPISTNHFTCQLGILNESGPGAYMEAIVDTGGCRTMMDIGTAKASGVLYKERKPGTTYGSFYGAAGEHSQYAGVIPGPVTI